MVSQKFKELSMKSRVLGFALGIASFWIAIKLIPKITQLVIDWGFTQNNFFIELVTIIIVYFLATFLIPIIGAIILLWLFVNLKK